MSWINCGLPNQNPKNACCLLTVFWTSEWMDYKCYGLLWVRLHNLVIIFILKWKKQYEIILIIYNFKFQKCQISSKLYLTSKMYVSPNYCYSSDNTLFVSQLVKLDIKVFNL